MKSLSVLGDSIRLYNPGHQKPLAGFMICSESGADETTQENVWRRVSTF